MCSFFGHSVDAQRHKNPKSNSRNRLKQRQSWLSGWEPTDSLGRCVFIWHFQVCSELKSAVVNRSQAFNGYGYVRVHLRHLLLPFFSYSPRTLSRRNWCHWEVGLRWYVNPKSRTCQSAKHPLRRFFSDLSRATGSLTARTLTSFAVVCGATLTPSVCLSVCLSHGSFTPKRVKIWK